jgi:hypothetical protein
MRWLKSIICTLCTLLILMQAGGLIQLYKAERLAWHYRTIQSSCRNTVTLSLPATEYLEGTKDSRNEIAIAGRMYDIVSAVTKGDSVAIVAIPDAEEDEIIDRIKKAVHNTGKELPATLWKLLELCYLAPELPKLEFRHMRILVHNTGYKFKKLNKVPCEISYPPEYC